MNAVIIHESRGRMRLQCRLKQKEMSLRQADLLEAWFQQQSWTSRVTVHERTGCVILYYTGARETVLRAVRRFSWEQAEQSVSLPAHSSRMLNRQFEEKLVGKAALKLLLMIWMDSWQHLGIEFTERLLVSNRKHQARLDINEIQRIL